MLQSCPTLCDPRDGSPPGSPVPGNLQARTLEWVAISFSNKYIYLYINIYIIDIYMYKYIYLYVYVYIYIYISAGKESTCNAGDPGLIAGMEDTLEKG